MDVLNSQYAWMSLCCCELKVPKLTGNGTVFGWRAGSGNLSLAAPVRGVRGVVASVGVVTLGELDEGVVGARVLAAAVEVADALR